MSSQRAVILCKSVHHGGALGLFGGINTRHSDGRDLERASRFAAEIAEQAWPGELAPADA